MSRKLSILFIITVFLLAGCESKPKKETSAMPQPTQKAMVEDSMPKTTNKEISNHIENDMLASIPLRDFPITDSTSFDNFEKSGIRDKGFLKRIKFDSRRKDGSNFRLNYKIPFSDNFIAVVVTYRLGEHELFTKLITVDKKYKIIDQLEIAYDEIAESAFGKTSMIEKDKIIVTSSNRMGEKPIFRDETYVLENTGKFKRQ